VPILAPRSACLLAGLAALAAAVVAPAAGGAPRARCPGNLATELASTGSASQLVTVVAARASSTSGTVRLWQRAGGCWRPAGGPWRAYLGLGGVSADHREGEPTTPAGAFGIGPVIYGVATDPGVHYPYHRLVCGDWWDEDPASPAYNTFQHVPCGSRPPFGGASEPLWESARAYSHFLFVRYNVSPAVPGRGSAIFIHEEIGKPTHGCVSLPAAELVRLLRWLRPARSPLVVIGAAAGIRRF
jgi:L,D-peptidoglycan transpeptidase YkuD (ErfK/YbiS/YcfS/YnhG family)